MALVVLNPTRSEESTITNEFTTDDIPKKEQNSSLNLKEIVNKNNIDGSTPKTKENVDNIKHGKVKIIGEDSLPTDVNDPCFFRCFKKLFSLGKRNFWSRPAEPQNIEESAICKAALETFSALMDDKNLTSLIGKEFTLNTSVSIQSIQGQGSEPNIIIQGSIPFTVNTPEGPRKKKVRVKGRLYNPNADNASRLTLSIVEVNRGFKQHSCSTQEIAWQTREIYTPEQYQRLIVACFTKKKNSDELNTRPSSNKSTTSEVVPIKSITLTRVRVRQLKFNDGTECQEAWGKEKIKLKMPTGVYMKKKGEQATDDSDDNSAGTEEIQESQSNGTKKKKYGEIVAKTTEITALKRDENLFTQNAFFCLKPWREPIFSLENDINPFLENNSLKPCIPQFNINMLKKMMELQTQYPWSHDRYGVPFSGYCPITWLYNSFDKTKAFVSAFSVNAETEYSSAKMCRKR